MTDARANALPAAGLLVPNKCNDAHDTTLGCDLTTADQWLKDRLPTVLASDDFTSGRLAVVVTADEDNTADPSPGGTVLTVVLHASLDGTHRVVSTPLTHYSLTRLYDQVLGAPPLRNADTAPDMAAAFGLTTPSDPGTPSDVVPVASFTVTPSTGTAPLGVHFDDTSTETDASWWRWTFGDGTTSSAQNPDHTYTEPGSYTVSLTVTNTNGSDTVTRTSVVTVAAPPVSDAAIVAGASTSTAQPSASTIVTLAKPARPPRATSWSPVSRSTTSRPSPTCQLAGRPCCPRR